jgi:hypothetical protein
VKTAARWAPLSGVVFVLLWILVFFGLDDDGAGDSDSEILAWYADSGNRNNQLVTFFLILASVLFFIWFVSVLRGRLASAEGTPGSHTVLAFGAGLVASALWSVASVFFMALSFAVDDSNRFVVDPNTYRLIDNMGYAIWFSGTTVAALLVFATALLSLKGQIVPTWLAWLSLVVAATMLVSFMFIPFLIFLGWVLVVSLVLVFRKPTPAPGAARATPAA